MDRCVRPILRWQVRFQIQETDGRELESVWRGRLWARVRRIWVHVMQGAGNGAGRKVKSILGWRCRKAVLKPPQSRRFATAWNLRIARSVWSAARFTVSGAETQREPVTFGQTDPLERADVAAAEDARTAALRQTHTAVHRWVIVRERNESRQGRKNSLPR
jgi:hypothetical protein